MKIEVLEKASGRHHLTEKREGKTLLTLFREAGVYLDAPCSGNGVCGKCRVCFVKNAPLPTGKENKMLSEKELDAGIRLACSSVPEGDCVVEIVPEREMEILAGTTKMKEIPAEINEAQGQKEIPAAITKTEEERVYGMAVDVGTTTLVIALVDIVLAEQIETVTSINHQRIYGADVLSRIQASNDGKKFFLQDCIRKDLRRMGIELLKKTGVEKESVKTIAVAGNTAMLHLLRGLSCETLGTAPFQPVDIDLWEGTAQQLFGNPGKDINFPWRAKVFVLPGISAFVGADIVSGIYHSGMHRRKELSLFLDIGTNGEMVLGNREGFFVTSAAAGPVFEGNGISCGMPGIAGAISHVWVLSESEQRFTSMNEEREFKLHVPKKGWLKEQELKEYVPKKGWLVKYQVIEDESAVGMCGSAVIDAVSELCRKKIIDENGTLSELWFTEGFPIAGEKIRLTQKDIREIQMGKAAIRAGIELLCDEAIEILKMKKETDITDESDKPIVAKSQMKHKYVTDDVKNREEVLAIQQNISQIYLAGGFGYALNVESAVRIGLIPKEFTGKIKLIGNSSLEGAKRFLCEPDAINEIKWIASHGKEINLAMHAQFSDVYMQHMFFENAETANYYIDH